MPTWGVGAVRPHTNLCCLRRCVREKHRCVCVEGGRCEDRGRWMVVAARRVVVEEVPEQNERRR